MHWAASIVRGTPVGLGQYKQQGWLAVLEEAHSQAPPRELGTNANALSRVVPVEFLRKGLSDCLQLVQRHPDS